ncbi:MAG: hypothetical protein BECKG1743D_GA0114223_101035 [Candidatus Kentron sp. G]|nr:MAG: hypothetical protein BECKG1743F_GA0114225_1003210 [Candidatus Kentron sp. G]VFM95935.1 MAG: hypothetical protein BECKG1743E_GA0114224_100269 [Candidatus Kentron sp. G]VFM99120.1 MAG: hypothetical protein BECKG1743D_GA0114223_101035 [Candidatus Kentron sp. G]
MFILGRKFSLNHSLFASNLRQSGHDFSLFRYDPHKLDRLLAEVPPRRISDNDYSTEDLRE